MRFVPAVLVAVVWASSGWAQPAAAPQCVATADVASATADDKAIRATLSDGRTVSFRMERDCPHFAGRSAIAGFDSPDGQLCPKKTITIRANDGVRGTQCTLGAMSVAK